MGLAGAARRIRPFVLCVVLPLLVALLRLDSLHDRFETAGYDFRGTLWEPAGRLLDGAGPYPSATDTVSLASGNPSVYPPLPIVLATPVARLGFDAAFVMWTIVLVAAVVASLWLVGIRDWRCHSLALLSPPSSRACSSATSRFCSCCRLRSPGGGGRTRSRPGSPLRWASRSSPSCSRSSRGSS